MITLSQDFIERINNKDTRKLFIAQVYYNDESFLALSSVTTTIDGIQYSGALRNIQGASHKWNITGDNNVTLSTPKITVVEYNLPNGYNIVDEFATKQCYGRALKLYIGFEGQSLGDMLRVFDGIVEDIEFKDGNIEIKGKTFEFPKKNIGGAKINFSKNKIGDITPGGYELIKEADSKNIPVPFGRIWNAPLVPYGKEGEGIYYAAYDQKYSDLIVDRKFVLTNIYHYNLHKTETMLMALSEDEYTPIHRQDWLENAYRTYNSIDGIVGNIMPGVKLLGRDQSNHSKSGDSYYVVVPLRYQFQSNRLNYSSGVVGSTADLISVFKPDLTTSPWQAVLNPAAYPNSYFYLYINTFLDMNWNLRRDRKGVLRAGRKISVPSTESNDGGQGFICGRWDCSAMEMMLEPEVWSKMVRAYNFKDAYLPPIDIPADQQTTRNEFIGGGLVNEQTPVQFWATLFSYNMNTKCYGNNLDLQTGYNFVELRNPNNTELLDPHSHIARQGSHFLTGSMGSAPFMNRDTFKTGKVGSRFEIHYRHHGAPPTGTFNLYKLYHATAGEISLSYEDNLYAYIEGVSLKQGNYLSSTPQHTNSYLLKRPYEYLELLLRKSGENSFASSFANSEINSLWENVYGTSRDYSGFVIVEDIDADDFLKAYIKNEQFAIYADEDGKYHFRLLKRQYTENDVQGVLDYNHASHFKMSMSPSKNIKAEILSLRTDYEYGIDDYALDLHWRLRSDEYDYSFWKAGNTIDNNEFKDETIEKQFTSSSEPDTVTYNGKSFGCIKSCRGVTPVDGEYWCELEVTADAPYNANTSYKGEDAESKVLAELHLNQWANRHRIVTFETNRLEYMKYSIGDIVEFTNVPQSLLGMDIKGFAGNNNFTSTVNGQTVYAAFVITSISKDLGRVVIEAFQLHDLNAYAIERVN